MTMPILKAIQLKKTVKSDHIFEKRSIRLLWDIPELHIETPGLYIIAGKNGVGKSTLLRTLLYLIRPDSGEVAWYGGKRLDAQVVGYLPEFPIIPPAAKVADWLSWMLDMSRKEMESLEGHLSRFQSLSIKHLFDVPANRLSKGQQQRVQLWNCLAHKPRGVILDEPFSGLDPWARVELAELLTALLHEGLFILMSTHELPQLLREQAKQTWVLERDSVTLCDGCALPA